MRGRHAAGRIKGHISDDQKPFLHTCMICFGSALVVQYVSFILSTARKIYGGTHLAPAAATAAALAKRFPFSAEILRVAGERIVSEGEM